MGHYFLDRRYRIYGWIIHHRIYSTCALNPLKKIERVGKLHQQQSKHTSIICSIKRRLISLKVKRVLKSFRKNTVWKEYRISYIIHLEQEPPRPGYEKILCMRLTTDLFVVSVKSEHLLTYYLPTDKLFKVKHHRSTELI